MVFDRDGIGGGITVFTQLENGRAELEITAYISLYQKKQVETQNNRDDSKPLKNFEAKSAKEDEEEMDKISSGQLVEFRILDGKHREIGSACVAAEEICTVKTILIHPHLWQSVDDPYVYTVKAVLLKEGKIQDDIQITHGIRTFRYLPIKGYCLNQMPFWLQAVRYTPPCKEGRLDEKAFSEEILLLKELGANTLLLKEHFSNIIFYQMCDEAGLVIWKETENKSEDSGYNIPDWSGSQGLIDRDRNVKNDTFYYFKACWSKDPFVYICGHEAFQKATDVITADVYSNQRKVALYVNGILFEFKESAPRFRFEEVPLGADTIVTAQAGECFYSVTWKKNSCIS